MMTSRFERPFCNGSERPADGELEALELVAIVELRRFLVSQGKGIAEPEQPERSEPLHGDSGRSAQLPHIERVVRGEAHFVGELRAAHVEGLPEIDERADTRALLELLRQGQDRLELPADGE